MTEDQLERLIEGDEVYLNQRARLVYNRSHLGEKVTVRRVGKIGKIGVKVIFIEGVTGYLYADEVELEKYDWLRFWL